MDKVKSPTKIMKINLVVENADGFGVRKHMKRTNRGKILHKY